MATRKAQQGRGTAPRLAHNQEAGDSAPPPATDDRDTERPPAPSLAELVPLSDDQKQALALIEELTERMVTRGIRRLAVHSRALELELELDPAAQQLRPRESVPSEPKREKPPGECVVTACEKKGGHLRTPYCRDHWHAELRSPRRSR